jgi:hypothetical protein
MARSQRPALCADPLARNDGYLDYFGCGTIRKYGFGAFQPCG